uniref:Uncharacterized protein n=1 Tax=Branchiostoma floridae TaxID=7739 RepID=C3XVN4_BRAFL|eukprot:XP_002611818.1 hypothetical protein BRAFLDRAFT_130248 [Branchiostoma floridae]
MTVGGNSVSQRDKRTEPGASLNAGDQLAAPMLDLKGGSSAVVVHVARYLAAVMTLWQASDVASLSVRHRWKLGQGQPTYGSDKSSIKRQTTVCPQAVLTRQPQSERLILFFSNTGGSFWVAAFEWPDPVLTPSAARYHAARLARGPRPPAARANAARAMMPDPPLCHVADRLRPDVPPRRPFSQPACYRRRLSSSNVSPCRSLTQPAARPHLPSCRLRSLSLKPDKTPSRSRPQPATCQCCPADHAAVCPTRPAVPARPGPVASHQGLVAAHLDHNWPVTQQ